jgi:hypothetical protein
MKTWLLLAALLAASFQVEAAGRLAQVQIVDKASGRVLPVHVSNGRHYVAGKPGKEYAIRVQNRLGEDLLAVVSVDGVNVVSGETAAYDQGGYILAPRSTFDIKGWRKSLERVAAFYFSRIEDSYAARTGRPEEVGVIGVALFKRKPVVRELEGDASSRKEAPAAPQAAERSASGAAAEPGLGTGHGRSVTSVVRYAEFERASDMPAEIVSIYYDSYENLVARGVIPVARRDPQPFPGTFVPDPPQG